MAIVFPPPPPTHNTLSTAQRSQLLRTNAKLGQVLGSTPYILDDICATAPPRVPTPEGRKPRHKGPKSADHSEQSKRSASPGSIASTSSSSASSSTARSSFDSPPSTLRPETPYHPPERTWRVRFPTKRPPILRVGKIFRSANNSSRDGSPEGLPSGSTDMPAESDSPPPTPSFAIQSEASARRQKMQRLTKKLGEGVPIHLVFPPTVESDDEEVMIDSPTSESSSSWSSDPAEKDVDLAWERYVARRSRFVQPPKTSVVANRYVVHYSDVSGTHGLVAETFQGLKCRAITTIPEEHGEC